MCLERTPLGSAKNYNPVPEVIMKITVVETMPCVVCGKTSTVSMNETELEAYKSGASIPQAFAHWTPDQRELLISGIHAECWETFRPTDEDEDWD